MYLQYNSCLQKALSLPCVIVFLMEADWLQQGRALSETFFQRQEMDLQCTSVQQNFHA